MALFLPGVRVRLGEVSNYTDEKSLGKELSQSLSNQELPEGSMRHLLLTLRGIGAGGEEFLEVLQKAFGDIAIFGGLGGCDYDVGMSHPDFWRSYQYLTKGVSPGGAKAAHLCLPENDYQPAFGYAHGWTPVGPAVTITRAEGPEVYEVDGIPVFEFYRQFLGGTDSREFFEGMIQRYAFSVDMEYEGFKRSVVRLPVKCDFSKGCITYFPVQDLHGIQVRLLHGDRRGVLNGARRAAQRCKDALMGMEPALLINISCCTRAVILHSRVDAEVEAIQEVFGKEIPIVGFYSGGEIFPYLSKYEDVVDPGNALNHSHYHATTVGVMALGTRLPIEKVVREGLFIDRDVQRNVDDIQRLLKESEGILDDTQGFLTAISRKSYEISEILKEQNEELQQKNEQNLRLQEIVHRYTPHEVWSEAGNSAKRGDYEIPEREVHRVYLFMDVQGFTAFSEKHDPTEVIQHLNAIFNPATEFIYEHEGDVDKFIGDCIFAVFPDSPHAVQAARKILGLFDDLKEKGNPFQVRIGINKGRAIHGNVGSANRREYTFIGDAVNLTQRLESSCSPGHILLSPVVYDTCGAQFEQVQEREITVKGKKEPLKVFECR
jgi:class 3 adenylate cyclase